MSGVSPNTFKPIARILGLPSWAGSSEILDAIRTLQRQSNEFQRSAENWAGAYERERQGRVRAEDPDNWRCIWTGDDATADLDTTALTHGNLVTLDRGTGQFLLYYRPCCENPSCRCIQRTADGRCHCPTPNAGNRGASSDTSAGNNTSTPEATS